MAVYLAPLAVASAPQARVFPSVRSFLIHLLTFTPYMHSWRFTWDFSLSIAESRSAKRFFGVLPALSIILVLTILAVAHQSNLLLRDVHYATIPVQITAHGQPR
jgi:hypothetical protein